MIWKHKFSVEELNSYGKGSILEHLDLEFTDFGDDYLEATMPVDHRTRQPAGILHGGASVVLAETLGSLASELCLMDREKYIAVGIEVNANHLKSATSGRITGQAKPIKIGRKMMVWSISIRNEMGETICISRLTTLVVERR